MRIDLDHNLTTQLFVSLRCDSVDKKHCHNPLSNSVGLSSAEMKQLNSLSTILPSNLLINISVGCLYIKVICFFVISAVYKTEAI